MKTVAETADECEICQVIFSEAREFRDESPEIKVEYIFGSQPYDIKRIRLIYQGPTSGDEEFATGFNQVLRNYMVHALPGDPAAQIVSTRPIDTAVGSSKSMIMAQSWLRDCCRTHTKCIQTEKKIMPTRCLKVDDLDTIHLCITHSQEDSYAALSYCWGPKQYPNLVTTRRSLNAMLENIPLSAFPPTLRDGIMVTHELGLAYLWIDALCIIQDDEDDKDNEIPQMRRIFSNAHCTIIAATAAHCHADFLHDRVLPASPGLCVPCPGPGLKDGHMFLKEHDPDQWSLYDPLEDPVNDRAWTLEERLLSSRRLIYSKNHLRWLCETSELTNGGDPEDRKWPSSSERNQIERLPPQLSPRITIPMTFGDPAPQDHDAWFSWLMIVREYNLRSLTKSKDKLRAIGGIAELYHLKTSDRYCAGLWRSHMAEELLWQVFHPRATFSSMIAESHDPTGTHRPAITLFPRPKYRAPTWSWASVDGTAANHRALTRAPFVADVFRVMDCVVLPKNPDALLTAVKSAVLTVHGRMKRALLHLESRMLYESEEAHAREEDIGGYHLDALEHEQFSVYRSVDCLEISSRIREGYIGNQQGLVLVEAAEKETFNRIGMFGTWSLHEHWFKDVAPQILRIT